MNLEEKKVLLCTHDYPPDSGGISAFARDLFYLLNEMNFGVELFYKKKSASNKLRALWNYINDLKSLLFKNNYSSYDVVICTRIQPFGIITYFLKPFFKAKLIIQVHGTEIEGRFKKGWRKRLYKLIFNNVDQVWANSNNTIKRLESFGIQSHKIKLVYPFLTKDIVSINDNQIEKKASEVFTIFTAGTLYPRKGVDLVLKALSKLRELDWQYIIAGKALKGYERYYEKMAIDLEINDKVKFLGQINREDVWTNMKMADLFVLTSREMPNDIESFGIVYIEAQYFNTPCIGSNIGGIPEAIATEHGGILIEDGNIEELKQAIELMLKDEKYKDRASLNSKKYILNNFSQEKRQTQINSLLNKLRY